MKQGRYTAGKAVAGAFLVEEICCVGIAGISKNIEGQLKGKGEK